MAKFLLPLAIITMIFSYQNCAESFDPNALEGGLASPSLPGNNGDGDETNNPPQEPTFDLTRLRASTNVQSLVQYESTNVIVNVANGDALPLNLDIRAFAKCQSAPEKELQRIACSEGACFQLSCDTSGLASFNAEVFHENANSYYSVYAENTIVEIQSLNKQNVDVEILNPGTINLNETKLITANFPASMLSDQDFSAIWTVNSNSCQLIPEESQLAASIHCTSEGQYTVALSASSQVYEGSDSTSINIGSPEIPIGVQVGMDRVYERINVTSPSMPRYSVIVTGLSQSMVSSLNWSHNAPGFCDLASVTTNGVTNSLRCLKRPPSGSVKVTAVINDSYYTGTASKSVFVDRGTLSVIFSGLADKQITRDQNLNATVRIDGASQQASGFTYKWNVCADANGSNGREVVKQGSNILTTGSACEDPGQKSFRVAVSNADWSGQSTSQETTITADYEYKWDITTGFADGNISNSCTLYDPGTCSANNVGTQRTCCEKFETLQKTGQQEESIQLRYWFCVNSRTYKCEAKLK